MLEVVKDRILKRKRSCEVKGEVGFVQWFILDASDLRLMLKYEILEVELERPEANTWSWDLDVRGS